MHHLVLLSTLSLVGLQLIFSPVASAASWTVSCSAGGEVVHTEVLDETTGGQRELDIRAKYPTAACVFLSEAPIQSAPSIGSGLARNDPYDLEAALRAISGERLEVAFPEPQSSAPDVDLGSASNRPPPLHVPVDHRPMAPGWIRLSMYRTGNISDALADWSRITSQEPSFRFLMPSVARVGDEYVMLSVGPVSNEDRPAVCVAASSLGLDCLAGPDILDEESLAIEYLSTAFPGAIDLPTVDNCVPAKPLAELGQDLPPGMRGGLTCWRSGFAADRMLPPFDPNLVDAVAATESGGPPLPQPRPVRTPGA